MMEKSTTTNAPERVVLIGSNIDHSRSPGLLNSLFERHQIPLVYELMPLEPEQVGEAVARMKKGGYKGANVTSPHKEIAFRELDECEPSARRIRAVNTLRFDRGRVMGFNTDVPGFADSIREERVTATTFTAAVLGSGGAARAAVLALLGFDTLASVTLVSREASRAHEAAALFGDDRVRALVLDAFSGAELIVNATPVGLPGRRGVLLAEDQLRGAGLFFDMVYSEPETQQMAVARMAGVRTVNGREMFLRQALAAFEIWTGISVDPRQVDRELWST